MNWIDAAKIQEVSYLEGKNGSRQSRSNSLTETRVSPVVTFRPCSCSPPGPQLSGGLVVDPRATDVFLGRGKGSYERRGNKAYMEIISSYLPAYVDSKGNKDKTRITEEIVALVKKSGGRFLGVDPSNGFAYQVSDADARMKVSQALRHQRLVRDKKKKRKSCLHLASEKENDEKAREKRKVNEEDQAHGPGIHGSKCADAAVPVADDGNMGIARNDHDFLVAEVVLSPKQRVEDDLYWLRSERKVGITNALIDDAPNDIISDDDLFSVLLTGMDNDLEFNIKFSSSFFHE